MCPAISRLDFSVFIRHGLNGSDAGRAYRDDAIPSGFCRVDFISALLGYLINLFIRSFVSFQTGYSAM